MSTYRAHDSILGKPENADTQKEILNLKSAECNSENVSSNSWCPKYWDGFLCWPSTAPGELAVLPCPFYVAGFNTEEYATRQCMPGGWWNEERNASWSNYTQCVKISSLDDMLGLNDNNDTVDPRLKKFFPMIKIVSKVGYSISLISLIVAVFILGSIKKLRCPRNLLHLHLFASFIFRAFVFLLKDMVFIFGIGPSSVLNVMDYQIVMDGQNQLMLRSLKVTNPWLCKMFTSFWEYFILANYFWILMEGLYLHNLVFLALFNDANSSIVPYACLGWGLPALFVLCWVAMRITLEDKLCWTTHENPYVFFLIRGPTMLSILISFVLFVNIVRVLFLKLKSTVSEETQRYKRWAKSTLVLVPLFGVHYAVFLGMSYSIRNNETVEVVWLFCDQLFASFQGFFVAVLYCFLNGEVRTEVTRLIKDESLPRFRRRLNSRTKPTDNFGSTCSCNATKLSKHSKRSRWWKNPPWVRFLHKRTGTTRRSTHSMASTQDIGTRGCSLASSKGYLEIAGNTQSIHPVASDQSEQANHTSPLYCKCTDQSLLSFCSNLSETPCTVPNIDRAVNHRWSDSECCSLTYELHGLRHGPP